MFQSRNRDAFRFKVIGVFGIAVFPTSFNLGIEMLFVSSTSSTSKGPSLAAFQSRNRDAFRFKSATAQTGGTSMALFQSRNRDAFRFKPEGVLVDRTGYLFQSRNRDAFRFKFRWVYQSVDGILGFNLGIEMLFVSS